MSAHLNKQQFIDGSSKVIDGITQVPRYGVLPTYEGLPSAGLILDVGAGKTVVELRYIVNAGNDVLAAEALRQRDLSQIGIVYPGGFSTQPVPSVDQFGQSYKVENIYVLAIGDIASRAGEVVLMGTAAALANRKIEAFDASLSEALASQVRFNFAAALRIQQVAVTLSPQFIVDDGGATGKALVSIGGYTDV